MAFISQALHHILSYHDVHLEQYGIHFLQTFGHSISDPFAAPVITAIRSLRSISPLPHFVCLVYLVYFVIDLMARWLIWFHLLFKIEILRSSSPEGMNIVTSSLITSSCLNLNSVAHTTMSASICRSLHPGLYIWPSSYCPLKFFRSE